MYFIARGRTQATRSSPGGARISYMTHAKFAGHVSCRREAVSRELKALERDGIVLKQRRQFIVPDIERLRKRRDESG